MKKILYILLVLSLSLFSLLIATEKNVFDMSHYRKNIIMNDIERVTGKDSFELKGIYYDIHGYLKDKGDESLLESNFNEREILHMKDVKVLFRLGFTLKYISIIASLGIIYILTRIENIEKVGRIIFKGLLANWLLLGILAIMVYYDFNKYFTYFHEIFFSNDLWILDPRTDLLIQMLPESFFSSIATDIGVSFLMNVATIQGIGYVTSKKGRLKDEKGPGIFKGKKQG
ncbi:MAG: TIGR01906 family membrane protein [Tissierellaceae bacterium]